ncbi:MAG TPA: hypothetical protein VFT37_06685 [Telluria sp.]|nr:hypothetical protein [Telluria sp.]
MNSHTTTNRARVLLAAAALALSVHASANVLGATPACGNGPADPASGAPSTLARALYEIVSGPAGAAKDWARLRRLHAPGALITPTLHVDGGFLAAPQSLEQFIALNDKLFGQRGFYERELAQDVRVYGHVAHVWSSYEKREREDGPVQGRGLNAFHMLNDGTRWCILSATWDGETPTHPLPAKL